MNDDRKPVWPWIASLLMGLPVLYVASIGPGYALMSRIDRRPSNAIWSSYCVPIQLVMERNETVDRAVRSYCRVCNGE
jgi:hypothetical protein